MTAALERYLDQLFVRFADSGDAEGLSLVTRRLADVRRRDGRPLEALELYRAAWELVPPDAPLRDEDAAASLLGMARSLLALGESEAAALAAGEAAAAFTAAGSAMGRGLARLVGATARGADVAVGAMLKAASDDFVAAGHAGAAAVALAQLTRHHLGQEQPALAEACAEQAARYAELDGRRSFAGMAAHARAEVALHRGDAATALDRSREAALASREAGIARAEAMALHTQARALAALGRREEADVAVTAAVARSAAEPDLLLAIGLDRAEWSLAAGRNGDASRALVQCRAALARLGERAGAPEVARLHELEGRLG